MKCNQARLILLQAKACSYTNLSHPTSKHQSCGTMQFYHAAAPPPLSAVSGQNRHPEYPIHYHQSATSPRMNWNPAAMHPGWGYDFSQYPGFNPHAPADPTRSPPYHGHVTSPDAASGSGTPHNIRDILGAQQQASLQSEIAKTPSSYQQSPTSTAASVFSPEHAHGPLRSPTTPNTPFSADASGAQSFYLPAMPRQGMHGEFLQLHSLGWC